MELPPSEPPSMSDLLASKSQRELDIATHISLKHRYVFFQVSKAASSTAKYHLQALEVKGTRRKISVNNRNLSPHVWPSQLREEDFLAMLDERLGESTFVAGERFTIADITALATVDFAQAVKVGAPDGHANIQRWHEAVSARPSAAA